MSPDSTLNQLHEAFPQMPASYGVYLKNTLVALCHALEDHILQTEQGQPLVWVTFQEGKWYLQEADRYAQIASHAQEVVIAAVPDSGFASHPTGSLPNVHLVHLSPGDPLAQEWNLIILDRGYAAMVLCHELPLDQYPAGPPSRDVERKFYGLWTFDRAEVEAAAEILIGGLRAYDPALADRMEAGGRILKADSDQHPQQDLTTVVARIVNYLQTSQEQLVLVQRQTREFWELESQALRLNRNLNANKLQALLRMAQRIDAQDAENPVASLQVAALAETLGQLLDLPTLRLRRLRLAGLLFRLMVAPVPKEQLGRDPSQEGVSHAQEMEYWGKYELLSSELLSAIPELSPVAQIIAHHLEHWNGSGHPSGLRGEEISLEARILGLVASFQRLLYPRGSHRAYDITEALKICQRYAGIRFDPHLVEVLASVIRLCEMEMMILPERPSHLPTIWLEENPESLAAGGS
ncbi:MAG: DICT sensory domain-containing protein [Cyanobacteriota bacterium]|nr:DICT sensory domain-containing protein [Cyanobacteriota bacterium]